MGLVVIEQSAEKREKKASTLTLITVISFIIIVDVAGTAIIELYTYPHCWRPLSYMCWYYSTCCTTQEDILLLLLHSSIGWLCWQVRNLCLSKRRRTYVCNDLLKIHHLCKKICGEKLLYLWIMLFYLYNACQWVVAAANILLYCCGIVLHNMPLLFFAPRLFDNKSNSGGRNMGGGGQKYFSPPQQPHVTPPRRNSINAI